MFHFIKIKKMFSNLIVKPWDQKKKKSDGEKLRKCAICGEISKKFAINC